MDNSSEQNIGAKPNNEPVHVSDLDNPEVLRLLIAAHMHRMGITQLTVNREDYVAIQSHWLSATCPQEGVLVVTMNREAPQDVH